MTYYSTAIPIDSKKTKPIPVIGTITCSQPNLAEQSIENYQYFSMWILPKDYNHVFFLESHSYSMEPTRWY